MDRRCDPSRKEARIAARPRLASDVFDLALDILHRYPNDLQVVELATMAADLHYGTELALAFMNRGISGDNARRLLKQYEQFKQRTCADRPGI